MQKSYFVVLAMTVIIYLMAFSILYFLGIEYYSVALFDALIAAALVTGTAFPLALGSTWKNKILMMLCMPTNYIPLVILIAFFGFSSTVINMTQYILQSASDYIAGIAIRA